MKTYKVYRNITKNCFSVLKYYKEVKGYRLLTHVTDALLVNVETRVSETGRQKVLSQGQKNVHAFLLCDHYKVLNEPYCGQMYPETEIYYNPYQQSCFTLNDQAFNKAESVILITQPKPKAYFINNTTK